MKLPRGVREAERVELVGVDRGRAGGGQVQRPVLEVIGEGDQEWASQILVASTRISPVWLPSRLPPR